MASYETDHNISTDNSRSRQTTSGHDTVAQHLSEFFSLEHDPQRRAEAGDYRNLANALEQLQSSPLVQQMIQQLGNEADAQAHGSPQEGVPQTFLDALDRIDKKRIKNTDSCAICATRYMDDPYPLVVRLPCDPKHHFDLECIGPWLKLHSSCPLCRKDLLAKRSPIVDDDDSEEEFDDTYG